MQADRKYDNPDLMDTLPGGSRKRLFIGLILGSGFLLCLVMILLWLIPFVGLGAIHPAVPWIFGAITTIINLFVLWAAFGLVYNILRKKPMPFTARARGLTIRLFLPLMTILGRALGISKQRIRSSFIKVNNELIESEVGHFTPNEILLLMPHCLQRSKCEYRLTYDINNCRRCGLCPIDGLLEVSEKYGVHLAIATGGTIARRIVVQKRPRLIIAVACERDLASGIQDTYPLPAYGVLNDRPFGPCLDTQVQLPRLEAAIRRFLHPDFVSQIDKTAARAKEQAAEGTATRQ